MTIETLEAEILFLVPDDVGPATAALIARGFEVEVLDWVDPYGPTIWIKARLETELDQDAFFDYAHGIADELNGDLMEVGEAAPPQAA